MANSWVQAPPVIPFAPNSDPKPEWAYLSNGPPSPPKPSPAAKPGPDVFFLLDTVKCPIPLGQEGQNMCWTLSPPPPGWTPPGPPPAAAVVAPQAPPSPPPAANKAPPPPAAAIWFSGAPSINGWTLVAPPPPPPTPVPAVVVAAAEPPVATQANQQGYYRIFYQLK